MASMGVEAIDKFAKTGKKPETTPGLDFFDTGVDADHRQAGRRRAVDHASNEGLKLVLGLMPACRR